MSNSSHSHGLRCTRLLCPSPSPGVWSNSCPLSQWCHPTISFSVSSFSPFPKSFQHQDLFQWVGSSHHAAKLLELQHQSFQWIFRVDFLGYWLIWSPFSPKDSQESSPTPQFESTNSLVLSLLYGPTLTSVHDYWKNHSFEYTDLCWQSNVSAF